MSARQDPFITSADPREVLTAIDSFDPAAPWDEVAPRLRITLPRRRPLPPGTHDLPSRVFPPGIRAGLGLDIGPAMLFVAGSQLGDWGVTSDEAFDRALANVSERVRSRRHHALLHEHIAGVPTTAFQSREGWASSLLLLPAELERVLGEKTGLVFAPMRDLILRMPPETDPGFARHVLEEFAAADMNALDVTVYSLIDGRLVGAIHLPGSARGELPMH